MHNAISLKDAIMVKSPFNTKIYGLEGADKFIIYQFSHTTIEIADFDPYNEIIDLSNLESYKNIEDLEIKDSNLSIILENDRIILLPPHLLSNDLSLGNFRFYENYNTSTSEESIRNISIYIQLIRNSFYIIDIRRMYRSLLHHWRSENITLNILR